MVYFSAIAASLAYLTAVASGYPASSLSTCQPGTTGEIKPPGLIDLQIRSPDADSGHITNSVLAVHKDDSEGHRFQDQVAIFSEVPKEAKTCSLNWRQRAIANETDQRPFKVYDANGLVSFRILTGFPKADEPVTWNVINSFVPPNAADRHMDFTNWDKVPTADEHGNGEIPCSESIYVRLSITDGTKGGVWMQQSADMSVYVSYAC